MVTGLRLRQALRVMMTLALALLALAQAGRAPAQQLNPPLLQFSSVNNQVPNPISIDYSPVIDKLILSMNYDTGLPYNFSTLTLGGVLSQYTNESGHTNEVYVATARADTLGGFKKGETYFGGGLTAPGKIGKIDASGNVTFPWMTLPDQTLPFRGGLHIDRYGAWGGDLIVAQSADLVGPAHLWRVRSVAGVGKVVNFDGTVHDPTDPLAKPILDFGVHIEGLTTLPNDPRFGPMAGAILTAGEFRTVGGVPQPAIYACYPVAQNPSVLPQYLVFGPDNNGRRFFIPDEAGALVSAEAFELLECGFDLFVVHYVSGPPPTPGEVLQAKGYDLDHLPNGDTAVGDIIIVAEYPKGVRPGDLTAGNVFKLRWVNNNPVVTTLGVLSQIEDLTTVPTAPITLSGYVYLDLNANNVIDPGVDQVLSGITINITGPRGFSQPVTTDANGFFSLVVPCAGDYMLTEVVPNGTFPLGAFPGLGGNPVGNPASATQILVKATTGGTTYTPQNFLLGQNVGVIGDTVFYDINCDGVQGNGEPGIPGATVALKDSGGAVIASTVTDANGKYSFTGLPYGTYTAVATSVPFGLTNNSTPTSQTKTLTPANPSNLTADFGFCGAGALGDTVWNDKDASGTQDAGEPGIPNVKVTAVWAGFDGVLGTGDDITYPFATTDANGIYGFTLLPAGNFSVTVDTVTLPNAAAQVPTFDADGVATPNVSVVTLAAGETNLKQDFGYQERSAQIDVFAYCDNAPKNNTPDPGEELAGVKFLVTGPGLPAGGVEITTGLNGHAMIGGLQAGAYTVLAEQTNVGGCDLITTASQKVTLNVGETGKLVYQYQKGSISGVTFVDLNKDGIQQVGEAGIGNVPVTLKGPGQPAGGTTILTNPDGTYTFPGLSAGAYTVEVPATAGGKDHVSGTTPRSVTLNPGEDKVNIDFGYKNGSISGVVYFESSNPVNMVYNLGTDVPMSGVVVTLKGGSLPANGITTTTDASGAYKFDNLPQGTYMVSVAQTNQNKDLQTTSPLTVVLNPGDDAKDRNFGYITGSISGYLYCDDNANNMRDAGEQLANQTVKLTGTTTDNQAVSKTTTTDANGHYEFKDLQAGTYTVTVPKTVGHCTIPNVSSTITLGIGLNPTADFQYKPNPGSISGRAWCDHDGNTSFSNPPDTPLGSLTVTLFDSSNVQVATKTTAIDGSYSFTGLKPGSYTVKISPATVGTCTIANPSVQVTVVSDQTATANFIYKDNPGSLCGYAFCDANGNGKRDWGNGVIKGCVWHDNDKDGKCDTGEKKLGGFEVDLYDRDGRRVAFCKTDDKGRYEFDHIPDGDYKVSFKHKNGRYVCYQDDHNVSCRGGETKTENCRYRHTQSGRDDEDEDDDDDSCGNGDGKADFHEEPVPNATIIVKDLNGVTVGTTTTDSKGYYCFPSLPAGTYKVYAQSPVGGAKVITTNPLTVTVTSGGKSENNNFGYDCRNASICGYAFCDANGNGKRDCGNNFIKGCVWHDTDKDGKCDTGEKKLGGIDVDLYDKDGRRVAYCKTDAGGWYQFRGVPDGSYRVRFKHVSGRYVGYQDDHNVSCSGGETKQEHSRYKHTRNGGDDEDEDRNDDACGTGGGKGDCLEEGIGNVTITIKNSAGAVVATIKTDADGYYCVNNLPADTYKVYAETPVGGKKLLTASPLTVVAEGGQKYKNTNFGYDCSNGCVKGRVWRDDNGNGKRDASEPLLAGVTIKLCDSRGNVVASAVTDSNGEYAFNGLPSGSYILKAPSTFHGYAITGNGKVNITVGGGQCVEQNFTYRNCTVSGYVYCDANKNGKRDNGEGGISGVCITLRDANGNKCYAYTDCRGFYCFNNVKTPGHYKVIAPSKVNDKSLTTCGSIDVNLSSGQSSGQNNFGYDCCNGNGNGDDDDDDDDDS